MSGAAHSGGASRRAWLGTALAWALAGCAAPRGSAPPGALPRRDAWSGRLSLRVEQDQAQSFFAAFELQGNAESGSLALFNPLGGTVARLRWAPGEALLEADGKQSRFVSLEALTLQATGTALPVAGLFQWLAGEQAEVSGWQADLRDLGQGRLVARRLQPLPAVEMRLILEL